MRPAGRGLGSAPRCVREKRLFGCAWGGRGSQRLPKRLRNSSAGHSLSLTRYHQMPFRAFGVELLDYLLKCIQQLRSGSHQSCISLRIAVALPPVGAPTLKNRMRWPACLFIKWANVQGLVIFWANELVDPRAGGVLVHNALPFLTWFGRDTVTSARVSSNCFANSLTNKEHFSPRLARMQRASAGLLDFRNLSHGKQIPYVTLEEITQRLQDISWILIKFVFRQGVNSIATNPQVFSQAPLRYTLFACWLLVVLGYQHVKIASQFLHASFVLCIVSTVKYNSFAILCQVLLDNLASRVYTMASSTRHLLAQ